MHSRITDQEKRRRVWAKTNGLCAHCGRRVSGRSRTINHFVPRSADGGNDLRNLMPLCRQCNMARNNDVVDPETFYTFASKDAIQQCVEYHIQWKVGRTGADGTLWGGLLK